MLTLEGAAVFRFGALGSVGSQLRAGSVFALLESAETLMVRP